MKRTNNRRKVYRARLLEQKIQIDVPDELVRATDAGSGGDGISNPAEAATVGLAEWVSRRKSELDDRDPNEKYEVNEALDELLAKKSNFSMVRHRVLSRRAGDRGIAQLDHSIARAAGAGLDVEVPFEIKALKTPGLVAPYFVQDNHGTMVVSDQAGGVYSVTFGGKATALADKTKIKTRPESQSVRQDSDHMRAAFRPRRDRWYQGGARSNVSTVGRRYHVCEVARRGGDRMP